MCRLPTLNDAANHTGLAPLPASGPGDSDYYYCKDFAGKTFANPDRASRHQNRFAVQLAPYLAHALDLEVPRMDAADVVHQRGFAMMAEWTMCRLGLSGLDLTVGRRGDHQLPADRLFSLVARWSSGNDTIAAVGVRAPPRAPICTASPVRPVHDSIFPRNGALEIPARSMACARLNQKRYRKYSILKSQVYFDLRI